MGKSKKPIRSSEKNRAARNSRLQGELNLDGTEPESESGIVGEGNIDEQLDTMFSDNWENTEAKSFDEVPVGTYNARIITGIFNNAKSSGRFQFSWESVIIDGDHRGRHLFKHDGLDTEVGISYFKGTLARLGYDQPVSKSELKELVKEIVDTPVYVVIRVSSKKRKVEGVLEERTNVRFVRVLDNDAITDDLDETELEPYLTSEDEVSHDLDPGNSEDTSTNQSSPSCDLKKGARVKLPEKKIVTKLAKQLGFEIDNYNSVEQLLCEMGDYCGLSGTFDTSTKLVTRIQKAVKEL